MRVVGYCRVSTEEQAREGLSLEAQESRIRAYCQAQGWELVGICRDEGRSAKDLNRPGLQAALAALERGEADGLVILKLDRLTRSVRDLGTLLEGVFRERALISITEALDTGSAAGRLVLNMLGAVSQWEREAIGERTSFVLQHRRQQGQWPAGRIPFGFRLAPDGHLVEDPEQMRIVRAIKRARHRGVSYRQIAQQFGVSVGLAHKLATTDLRVIRNRYQGVVHVAATN